MVPLELATQITGKLTIPTVGIGAGPNCDAQVLVWQDMVMTSGKTAKFRQTVPGMSARTAAGRIAIRERGGHRRISPLRSTASGSRFDSRTSFWKVRFESKSGGSGPQRHIEVERKFDVAQDAGDPVRRSRRG